MDETGNLRMRLKSQMEQDAVRVRLMVQRELNLLTKDLKQNVRREFATIYTDMDNNLLDWHHRQNQNLEEHITNFDELLAEISTTQKKIASKHLQATEILKRGWIIPATAGLILTISIACSGYTVLHYLSQQAMSLNKKIQVQEQILTSLQTQGKYLKCDGRPCAQIDLKAARYQNGYRILKLD